jgi:hypothetical protein
MVQDLISEYPSIINWLPLSLLGFWTQQVFIFMNTNTKRQEIITSIDIEGDGNKKLVDDNGKWLYIWLLGTAGILSVRFVVVWHYL